MSSLGISREAEETQADAATEADAGELGLYHVWLGSR